MPGRLAEIPRSDAIVIGSGPNGLAAAVALAQRGCSVVVIEGSETIGGGARTAELTLPGFQHDICSAVYPLGVSSPFFRTLPLEQHGLEWVHSPAPLAHALDDGRAVMLERSVDATAAGLGDDGEAYRALMSPLAEMFDDITSDILGPLKLPRHPRAAARFGIHAMRSAASLLRSKFQGERALALLAGMAGHAMLPLEKRPSAAFCLLLAAAGHAAGWPIARGGAQQIAGALASYLRSLGGSIVTGAWVESLDELPAARAVLCDLTPRQFLRVAGKHLPRWYERKLKGWRYGMGAFKVDWALRAPIPWRAAECRRAATVHVGGAMEEIAAGENAVWRGDHAQRPLLLLSQPSLFDRSRAPAGQHTAWAYCHVPNGSTFDMLERIEQQIERFAPGFRELVLARSLMNTRQLEQHNPNLVGGDINGGVQDLGQLFRRPTWRFHATPRRGLYLCSSSTPPGGGVHGMCGFAAAQLALKQVFGK